jgi:acyl-CoA synthetase (AMP-forming)/AMP-acid ligase II
MALLPFEQMTAQDRQAVRAGGGLPAGRPVPGIDLRILEDTYGNPRPDCSVGEFDAMTLAADAVGEIVVSGPQVAKGYLGGRGDSANKFRVDGTVWHRTGDAGRLDAQGRLWLLGRCTARIHTPLGAHYPLATEAALSERPEVERSALLHRGQRTVLVVQMAQGGQPADVDEICRAVPWVAIDDVAVVGRLPLDRRHNAKVDYPALHALLDAGRGVTWHRPGFTRGR